MDISKEQIQVAVPSAFESCLQKANSNSKPFQQPAPRIFHSCVCHRAFIFIYGGLSLNPAQQFQNEHLFVYRYEIHRFEWKRIQLNFPNSLGPFNPLQNIYSHSCVVYGNVMYLFGGKSGKDGQCQNELWAMNLQSFNWRKQDQKGVIPAKRQSASLVLVSKSFLFLYGGKNEAHIFNDIHIYKIESKQWYSIENTIAEFIMPKRLRPGICAVNEMIYVFGGDRESSLQDRSQILDDFYQIRIVQKATSIKPDVWVKKLTTVLNPGKINAPKLFSVNDKYVGLVSGNSSIQFQGRNKLWLHDPHKLKWMYSQLQDPNKFQLGFGFNTVFQYDRVYISGGLKSDLTPLGPMYSIHIDSNDIPASSPNLTENGGLCMICGEQKKSLCRKKLNGFTLLQQALKQIKYPFNAFGFLVDNSNLLKSSLINIECCQTSKQKYLLISDDGSCENIWQNEEQFLDDMIKFRTISEQQMEVDDQDLIENHVENNDQANIADDEAILKKRMQQIGKQDQLLISAKKEEEKQEQRKLKKKKEIAKKNKARKLRKRKQFSINIKLGAMRLAKKMIYITETSDGSKRVFFMQQLKTINIDQSQHPNGDIKYQCHYYLIPSPTSTHTNSHHSSEVSRHFIESQYKNYLKGNHQNSTFKNHLILIGLKEIVNEDGMKEPELKINTKVNDIYLGTNKLISKAEALNIFLPDCIDISLKCYLSMLYLEGKYAKITISIVPEKNQEISSAIYFDKIDNLVKSNAIMDLDAAFDLEQCKVVELYYCKNLLQNGKKTLKNDKKQKGSSNLIKQSSQSSSHGVFFNGILIYHRNRLIKRYEYPLGSLLKYKDLKIITTKNYNPLEIFGFIELDEVFYSNIFKTNFVNDENLDNMYGRIKFVEEYLETKNQQLPNQISTKRSFKKMGGQPGEEQPDTKKRIKGE